MRIFFAFLKILADAFFEVFGFADVKNDASAVYK